MKIAIRTDASNRIGSGHVMRCKTLAEELCRRNADVRFVCREHAGNLAALLQEGGYAVDLLPPPANVVQEKSGYAAWLGVTQSEDAAQTTAALGDFAADWLVVDHYGLDQTWEKSLRTCTARIFAIDDLANRRHDCDLLLDQNWFGAATQTRYDGLVSEKCQRLLGPRHALLQPLFRQLRDSLPEREGRLRRVLMFFGAVDTHNQTVKALRALTAPQFADIAVDVVIGSANRHDAEIVQIAATRPGTTLHRRIPSLSELMASADLMLGAGGSTTWERCCLGLPSIVVAGAENQQGFTRVLADEGVHFYLGLAAAVEESAWETAIGALGKSLAGLQGYALAASRITDGLGAPRVAAAMQKQVPCCRLRRATPQDEALLFDWANDAETRRQAFSSAAINRETHHEWMKVKLTDPRCLLLIGEDDYGLPVGQVRFDLCDGEALIDFSVEPVLRGRGLGRELLHGALEFLRQENRASRAVGEVLTGNPASSEIFRRLGFKTDAAVPGRAGSCRFVLPLKPFSPSIART